MINPYFHSNYSFSNTQNLLNVLCIEAIKSHGYNVNYIPREIINYNEVLGEAEHYKFSNNYIIEMYLVNYENWGGQGDIMSKFGIQINDTANFIVSKQRFEEELGEARNLPQEGDMIYFPLSKSFFTIKHMDYDSEFWPHGNNYIYSLKTELADFSGENMDEVANTEIIDEISKFPVNSSNTFMPDDTQSFEESSDTYIDESEDNPYKF